MKISALLTTCTTAGNGQTTVGANSLHVGVSGESGDHLWPLHWRSTRSCPSRLCRRTRHSSAARCSPAKTRPRSCSIAVTQPGQLGMFQDGQKASLPANPALSPAISGRIGSCGRSVPISWIFLGAIKRGEALHYTCYVTFRMCC